jgi:GNAT superfamily N-acetyltransferase
VFHVYQIYIFVMYELILLENSSQAQDYETLTFPYYRLLLQKLAPDVGILAIGVHQENEPVGLLFAVEYKDKETAQKKADVKSLFIKPEYRCQGVGTRLLQRLEFELQQRGCRHIQLTYTETPNTEKLNPFLIKSGWTVPENTAILFYCSSEKVRIATSPHFLEREAEFKSKLSSKYEIFPWAELKKSEREAIIERMKIDNVWLNFNPFMGENRIDTVSSYGVRYEGQVIGWTISHNMVLHQTTFATMFITPECKLRSRVLLSLMSQAINSCFRSGCPIATFRTETSNTLMLKFIDRWITPYIETKRYVWSSQKILDF